MSTTTKNDLDLAFEELEKDYADNKVIRKEMIANLRKQLAKTEITEYDKPMMITAKLEIFKTLDSLIKSDEDVSMKKVKFKLARKDSETNGAVGTTIINLLKQIRVNDTVQSGNGKGDPTEDATAEIEARAAELIKDGDEKVKKALEVSDGELTECDSVPSSDNSSAPIKPLEKEDDE